MSQEKQMSFELLLVKDEGNFWSVHGITYSNALNLSPEYSVMKASMFAIQECKKALAKGKKITIAKAQDYSEVLPADLVIEALDDLDRHKQMAINEVAARMHQMLISISVIDLMDYLNNYVCLLNAGYFITDTNREDKYFEVIEASQECEDPGELKDNATFEEQQEFSEKKRKFNNAQFNLSTLEKYLNSYDRLVQIKSKAEFLTGTRKKIQQAKSIDEIDQIMRVYKSNLENYKMVKVIE